MHCNCCRQLGRCLLAVKFRFRDPFIDACCHFATFVHPRTLIWGCSELWRESDVGLNSKDSDVHLNHQESDVGRNFQRV